MEFDSAWCPACDRQIQPKKFTISVPVQHQLAPPPPPPSPKKAIKQKQGFVNGTGRLRHNGTIKQQQPQIQLKKRTIIDQGPIPLYCSDECQLADLSATRSGPPLDPAREEPMSTAAPIKFSTTTSETESDDTASSSSSGPPSSIAKLAKLYNFPPLPPPPPAFDDLDAPIAPPREYTSGIMMAGRLIASLCPPPAKPHIGPHRPPPETRKPVPGWTDGSNAWRASVYSFSSPQQPQNLLHRDESNKAYSSFTASPHRAPRSSSSSALSNPPPPPSQRSSSDEMIAKFSQSFQRRSESRTSLYPSTPTPTSPTSTHSISQSPPKRERTLLPRGMEGKLLVPNVKLKVHSSSSASLSSTWSGLTSASSARSPLSVTSDSEEEGLAHQSSCDSASSLPGYRKRPTVETRSWSYDNFKTYPVMQLPPKKIKQIQKQIVDGEEREVEVEVEVMEERKRLFIFAPSLQVSQ